MEQLIAFFQLHGLTAAAFIGAWAVIKYYVGRDIKETRDGIAQAKKDHDELTQYVEDCEDEMGKKFSDYEKEFQLLKQETQHLSVDVKGALGRIENNLKDHIKKEESYQRDITQFMGYVYRHLGNGVPPPAAPPTPDGD